MIPSVTSLTERSVCSKLLKNYIKALLPRKLLLKQISKVCFYTEGKLVGMLLPEKIRLKVTLLITRDFSLYLSNAVNQLGDKNKSEAIVTSKGTMLQYCSLFVDI